MRLAIVGAGRMGTALCNALSTTTIDVSGPFGRGFDGDGFDAVLLAVPDAQIAIAAATIGDGPMIGHCAGSLGLDVLGPREAFAVHPLMTVTASGATFAGAGAAVAAWIGATSEAVAIDPPETGPAGRSLSPSTTSTRSSGMARRSATICAMTV